jgi:hypothetical protein
MTGDFAFSVFVTNGPLSATSLPCLVSVFDFPTVACPSVLFGEVTVALNSSFVVVGGSAQASISLLVNSTLPLGVSFNPTTKSIVGTPQSSGSFQYQISYLDVAGANVFSSTCGLDVVAAPTVSCCGVFEIAQGVSLSSCSIGATGGSGAFVNWTISSGSLPPNVTLGVSTGSIQGSSTVLGDFAYTVQVFDTAGGFGISGSCQLRIVSPPTLQCPPSSLAALSTPYSSAFQVFGGSSASSGRVFQVSSLPSGLEIESISGSVSGTPLALGNVSFNANVTDASGGFGFATCSISVTASPTLRCPNVESVDLGSLLSTLVEVSGGAAPFTFQLTGGSLPAGLVLDLQSGTVSGSAVQTETKEYGILVMDVLGRTSPAVSCRMSVVVALNVTIWPRVCTGGIDWSGAYNLAQEDTPSSNVDFMLSSSWTGNSSETSSLLTCQSFCGDQRVPPDAILQGVVLQLIAVSDSSAVVSAVSLLGNTGPISSAAPRSPVLPTSLPTLAVPTFYDLSYQKLLPFSVLFGSSGDNWNLGTSASVLTDPNSFGVSLGFSNPSQTVARVNVFALSVQVFFKTSTPSFVAPLSNCPAVQTHDTLPARSLSCVAHEVAQCNISASSRYSIASTNCQNQALPTFTIPLLVSNVTQQACPFGQV